jgi:repressor LexA
MPLTVKDGLTKKQEIVLRYIIKCIKERGYPPILKEIAKEVGVGTEMGASRHIEALVKKGYIKKEKKIHRGIQPVEGVEDLLEGINQQRLFEAYQKEGAR